MCDACGNIPEGRGTTWHLGGMGLDAGQTDAIHLEGWASGELGRAAVDEGMMEGCAAVIGGAGIIDERELQHRYSVSRRGAVTAVDIVRPY